MAHCMDSSTLALPFYLIEDIVELIRAHEFVQKHVPFFNFPLQTGRAEGMKKLHCHIAHRWLQTNVTHQKQCPPLWHGLFWPHAACFTQNKDVAVFWGVQWLLFYFWNLSRADFWLARAAIFFSFAFRSCSSFILSSILFTIRSWMVKATTCWYLQQMQPPRHQHLIADGFWGHHTYPLVNISDLSLPPFHIACWAAAFFLISGDKLFFGKRIKALERQTVFIYI